MVIFLIIFFVYVILLIYRIMKFEDLHSAYIYIYIYIYILYKDIFIVTLIFITLD